MESRKDDVSKRTEDDLSGSAEAVALSGSRRAVLQD